MVKIRRWFCHAFLPPWRWRVMFSKQTLAAIEVAVQQSESQHCGEVRFAIENTLPPSRIWRGVSAQQRATEVFSNLRVWDTEANCGVLIYILLADKEVHIIADRGIATCVTQNKWDNITDTMRQHFLQNDFHRGSIEGIKQVTQLLVKHFPAHANKLINELPDRPVIVR